LVNYVRSAVAPFDCATAVASFGCDMAWGGSTIGELCPESCGLCGGGDIEGCIDDSACNYNPDATVDDGSCLQNDCEGECGGSAVVDECGVCGGDGSDDLGCGCFAAGPSGCDNVCGSTLENDACGVCGGDGSDDQGCGCFEPGPSGCDNVCGSTLEDDACGVCGGDNSTCAPPDEFAFNQSTQQAFYFFMTATIGGESLASDDWIGSFRNGYCSNPVATTEYICDILGAEWNPEEICVGARKWGDCVSAECDVPAMGVDGSDYTVGYMIAGAIPSFKIYDASNDEYLDAIVSDDYPWANQGMFVVNSLENAIVGCLEMDACNYDENANVGGECTYPEENYDCEGNCIITTDCNGDCGGNAALDQLLLDVIILAVQLQL